MGKILENLNFTLLVGLVLALVVILAVPANTEMVQGIFRWLHLFFGITWIGLLYYFNFVQIPTMPKIPAELKPGVAKHIAPSALFYFRWGAAFTVLTGLIVAYLAGYVHQALLLQEPYLLIGIGMWLALIMAANVWFVIWPNQKKVLGLVEATPDAKKAAGRVAMLASRTNTLLSIAMLYCMVGQQNVG